VPPIRNAIYSLLTRVKAESLAGETERLPEDDAGVDGPRFPVVRERIGWYRSLLYLKVEKLRAVASSGRAKRILFAGKPEWAEDILSGFRRLPHTVEFGPITAASYEQYDLVVPLSFPALEDALRHAPEKQGGIPMPSLGSVRLCDDKYEFNRSLIESGFGRYIPQMAQGLSLNPPYILKKRTGWFGAGCYIIRDERDEETQISRILDDRYFCQELIAGTTEFATHILFVGGKIVKALNIKYEFASKTPIKGQSGDLLFRAVHGCQYLDLFAEILGTIGFEGLCCVNYKIAGGRPYLLEINPRFGGSLAPYFFSFVRHLG
jgi:hypothetical protein